MNDLASYLSLHSQSCHIWNSCEGKCTCGLEEAKVEFRDMNSEIKQLKARIATFEILNLDLVRANNGLATVIANQVERIEELERTS